MANGTDGHASDVEVSPTAASTAAKLRFLRQPESYPDRPRAVRVVETHYAWVFMTGQVVYKLKKPVRLGAVDFTSLQARRTSCELEFRLNRGLAAQTYLGVTPLTSDDDGRLEIGGSGKVIDWLVKMRELPRNRMMDTAIRAGTVTAADTAAVVAKLVQFYGQTRVSEETGSEYRQRLRTQLVQAHDELSRPEFALNARLLRTLRDEQLGFLRRHASVFDARVAEKRIREVHGDLKPEHVCLSADPQIIDRLEFSRELRLMDCLEEIVFLAMECTAMGGREIARRLLAQYRELAGDAAAVELVGFYLSQRATVRAMLAAWHLEDAAVTDDHYWRQAARRYARKALHYLRRPNSIA